MKIDKEHAFILHLARLRRDNDRDQRWKDPRGPRQISTACCAYAFDRNSKSYTRALIIQKAVFRLRVFPVV